MRGRGDQSSIALLCSGRGVALGTIQSTRCTCCVWVELSYWTVRSCVLVLIQRDLAVGGLESSNGGKQVLGCKGLKKRSCHALNAGRISLASVVSEVCVLPACSPTAPWGQRSCWAARVAPLCPSQSRCSAPCFRVARLCVQLPHASFMKEAVVKSIPPV